MKGDRQGGETILTFQHTLSLFDELALQCGEIRETLINESCETTSAIRSR